MQALSCCCMPFLTCTQHLHRLTHAAPLLGIQTGQEQGNGGSTTPGPASPFWASSGAAHGGAAHQHPHAWYSTGPATSTAPGYVPPAPLLVSDEGQQQAAGAAAGGGWGGAGAGAGAGGEGAPQAWGSGLASLASPGAGGYASGTAATASPHAAQAVQQPAAGAAPPQQQQQDAGAFKAVVFGLINAAVGLPALIAFAAIVFQAPVFTPYLGSLCKMFFFSSGIHQLVFVAMSSLPFAIGQVRTATALVDARLSCSAGGWVCTGLHLPACLLACLP